MTPEDKTYFETQEEWLKVIYQLIEKLSEKSKVDEDVIKIVLLQKLKVVDFSLLTVNQLQSLYITLRNKVLSYDKRKRII